MEFNVETVAAGGAVPEPKRKVGGPGQARKPSPFDGIVATALAAGDTSWKGQSFANDAEKDLVIKELDRAVKRCNCAWEQCSNPEDYPGRLVFFIRPKRAIAPRKPRTPKVAVEPPAVAAPTVAAPPIIHPHLAPATV
jgi:hypothetical protein